MDPASRLLRVRLLQQMDRMPDYARHLGLSDCSAFHGQPVSTPTPPESRKNSSGVSGDSVVK